MREISIIIFLIYRKLGSAGSVQQKIKLRSPNVIRSSRLEKSKALKIDQEWKIHGYVQPLCKN